MYSENEILNSPDESLWCSAKDFHWEDALLREIIKFTLDVSHTEPFSEHSSFRSFLSIINSPDLLRSGRSQDKYTGSGDLDKIPEIKLSKIISEILETEDTYVTAMLTLNNNYLEPLKILKSSSLPPVLANIIPILLELSQIHLNNVSHIINLLEDGKDLNSLVVQVVELIVDSLQIGLYEVYLVSCENVVRMMRHHIPSTQGDMITLDNDWTKGLKNFLEKNQQPGRSLDLSFMSLLIRPIFRIAKYRLFLESIIKCVDEDTLTEVKGQMDQLLFKVLQINHREPAIIDINERIDSLISFDDIKFLHNISLDYFGPPLLVGTLSGTWMEDYNSKSTTFGSFLFKNSLILCDMSSRKCGKHGVKFVLPLENCKLLQSHEISDGLQTDFDFQFKLKCEKNLQHFEVLFFCLGEKDYFAWVHTLRLMIEEVNGPYTLDFSKMDDSSLVFHVPNRMSAYDRIENEQFKFKRLCYNRTLIEVKVALDFYSKELKTFHSFSLQKSAKANSLVVKIHGEDIYLSQKSLSSVSSKELEDFTAQIEESKTLHKSDSWSSLKSSLRHSHSLSGSLSRKRRSKLQIGPRPSSSAMTETNYSSANINTPTFVNADSKLSRSKSAVTISLTKLTAAQTRSPRLRELISGLFRG